jgi:osmotically-inducible protein OsmY
MKGSSMPTRLTALPALLLALLLLQGCAVAVVGGAAVGVATVHDRRTSATILEDQQIKVQARGVLNEHPEIKAALDIKMTSYNQRLLIVGRSTDLDKARRFAILLADIPNVKAVFNEVEEGERIGLKTNSADALLVSRAKIAMMRSGIQGFDPTRVKVVSSAGNLYLMGILTRQEADAVIDTLRNLRGVNKVVDIFEYVDQ